jgi:hypothetical protein
MPIDPFTECVATFSALAKLVPRTRNNRPVHHNTLRRWALKGRHGIKLETIMIGCVQCSSKEALVRFFEELTAFKQGPPPPHGRDAERQARVERQLKQFGL